MQGKGLLGRKLIDRITGFSGTATGICHYLHGKTQILIEARMRTDDKPATNWIEEDRLEEMETETTEAEDTGSPQAKMATGPTGMGSR